MVTGNYRKSFELADSIRKLLDSTGDGTIESAEYQENKARLRADETVFAQAIDAMNFDGGQEVTLDELTQYTGNNKMGSGLYDANRVATWQVNQKGDTAAREFFWDSVFTASYDSQNAEIANKLMAPEWVRHIPRETGWSYDDLFAPQAPLAEQGAQAYASGHLLDMALPLENSVTTDVSFLKKENYDSRINYIEWKWNLHVKGAAADFSKNATQLSWPFVSSKEWSMTPPGSFSGFSESLAQSVRLGTQPLKWPYS